MIKFYLILFILIVVLYFLYTNKSEYFNVSKFNPSDAILDKCNACDFETGRTIIDPLDGTSIECPRRIDMIEQCGDSKHCSDIKASNNVLSRRCYLNNELDCRYFDEENIDGKNDVTIMKCQKSASKIYILKPSKNHFIDGGFYNETTLTDGGILVLSGRCTDYTIKDVIGNNIFEDG